MPTNSAFAGAFWQYNVDGTTPRMSTVFLACLRYVMAFAINSSVLFTPADFANVTIASALSCWSQGSAVERSALIPSIPASFTHGPSSGLGAKMLPPLTRHRSCQLWATAGRSSWTMRLVSVELEVSVDVLLSVVVELLPEPEPSSTTVELSVDVELVTEVVELDTSGLVLLVKDEALA